MLSLSCWIWFLSCDPSFVVIEAAITGRETPHERPSACLCGTKTYGTFCAAGRDGVKGGERPAARAAAC